MLHAVAAAATGVIGTAKASCVTCHPCIVGPRQCHDIEKNITGSAGTACKYYPWRGYWSLPCSLRGITPSTMSISRIIHWTYYHIECCRGGGCYISYNSIMSSTKQQACCETGPYRVPRGFASRRPLRGDDRVWYRQTAPCVNWFFRIAAHTESAGARDNNLDDHDPTFQVEQDTKA